MSFGHCAVTLPDAQPGRDRFAYVPHAWTPVRRSASLVSGPSAALMTTSAPAITNSPFAACRVGRAPSAGPGRTPAQTKRSCLLRTYLLCALCGRRMYGKTRSRRAYGVFRRTRCGLPWREVPPIYGHWKAVYNRHRRWSAALTWARNLVELRREADAAEGPAWLVGVDAGVARARQHAAGARHLPPTDVAVEVVADARTPSASAW